jgi:UTP--glucose-1-phosphate uridylyltransferase
MNEKPKPTEAFSEFAILGRYVLTSGIFAILENTPPGHGGEIQLTDGLRALCKASPMVAVDFEGRRYDTGNITGFLEATIDFALKDTAVGPWLMEFMRDKVKGY